MTNIINIALKLIIGTTLVATGGKVLKDIPKHIKL